MIVIPNEDKRADVSRPKRSQKRLVIAPVPHISNARSAKPLRQAGEIAGLEWSHHQCTTADALAYGLEKEVDETSPLSDIGGGNFDACNPEVGQP